eukprot:1191776-Prorocentrum_minimum.AAC.1
MSYDPPSQPTIPTYTATRPLPTHPHPSRYLTAPNPPAHQLAPCPHMSTHPHIHSKPRSRLSEKIDYR